MGVLHFRIVDTVLIVNGNLGIAFNNILCNVERNSFRHKKPVLNKNLGVNIVDISIFAVLYIVYLFFTIGACTS